MTKTEIATLRNVIASLKCEPRIDAQGNPFPRQSDEVHAALTDPRVKLYLDTWVVSALQLLLPESRNPELALSLSD